MRLFQQLYWLHTSKICLQTWNDIFFILGFDVTNDDSSTTANTLTPWRRISSVKAIVFLPLKTKTGMNRSYISSPPCCLYVNSGTALIHYLMSYKWALEEHCVWIFLTANNNIGCNENLVKIVTQMNTKVERPEMNCRTASLCLLITFSTMTRGTCYWS
jgi:hypothetical protein